MPYYETADLMLEARDIRAELRTRLRLGGLELWRRELDGTEARVGPGGLPEVVAAAALLPLVHGRLGAELDLVVADQLVSVWSDPGRITVAWGFIARGGLYHEVASERSLRERWGFGRLTDHDRVFDPLAYGLLDTALGNLLPAERERIADVEIRRSSTDDERSSRSAKYHRGRDGVWIDLFDVALVPSTHFVGPLTRPSAYHVYVILHELGHAFADGAQRRAHHEIVALVAGHDLRVAAYRDDGPTPEQAAYDERALATVRALAAFLDQGRAVERAYATAVGEEQAPTRYGRSETSEAFAEAFALARLDPEALDRAAPRAAAWFREGQHLVALEAEDRRVTDILGGLSAE